MTQTRKEALTDLLAKVEVNEAPHWRAAARAIRLHPDDRHLKVIDAFDGSLDAAKALHEAALPGEGWEVYRTGKYPGMIPGSSPFKYAARVGYGTTTNGDADDPARAWLIAILKALIAQEPDQ